MGVGGCGDEAQQKEAIGNGGTGWGGEWGESGERLDSRRRGKGGVVPVTPRGSHADRPMRITTGCWRRPRFSL